jgi:hypothetical protein
MTKQMIESEHTMALGEAIEAEAQAQALCMQHPDFGEAHAAFKDKRPARFRGAPEWWCTRSTAAERARDAALER